MRRKAVTVILIVAWVILISFGIVSQFDPQWLRDIARVGAKVEAQVSFDAGYIQMRNGEYPAAIANYERALEIKPDFMEAYLNQAIAYARSGNFVRGENTLRAALDIDTPQKGKIHYNLAKLYEQQEKWDDAIMHYQEALRLNVNPSFVYQKLGIIYVHRQDYANAREALESCLAALADLALFYRSMLQDNISVFAEDTLHLGIIKEQLARTITEDELARYDLSTLRRVNLETPEVARIHSLLGFVCANLSDVDAAIAHFEESLGIDPSNGEARKNLANLLEYRESRTGEGEETRPGG